MRVFSAARTASGRIGKCRVRATLAWKIALPMAGLTAVVAGSPNRIVMRGAQGNDYPNAGVYLEVVPSEKIAFTDAFTEAWAPPDKPFMTAIITFEDLGEGHTK